MSDLYEPCGTCGEPPDAQGFLHCRHHWDLGPSRPLYREKHLHAARIQGRREGLAAAEAVAVNGKHVYVRQEPVEECRHCDHTGPDEAQCDCWCCHAQIALDIHAIDPEKIEPVSDGADGNPQGD